jgi:hypothetical protein
MKRTALRRMLVLVGLVAMTLSAACGSDNGTGPSSTFNVVGRWTVTETYGSQSQALVYTFTGTASGGTLASDGGSWTGTYTANGSSISWTLNGGFVMTGTFESANSIKGTISRDGSQRGTFSATRL